MFYAALRASISCWGMALIHTGPFAILKKFCAPQFLLANSVNCYQGRPRIIKIKIPTRTLFETIKENPIIKKMMNFWAGPNFFIFTLGSPFK